MYFLAQVDLVDMNVPAGARRGLVIVANHRSMLDLAVGLLIFRHWRIAPLILIRDDYFRNPVLNLLFRSIGGIPIGRASVATATRRSRAALASGGILVIMPEGRIPSVDVPRPILGRLMPGAARLASETGSAVLAVGLTRTDLAWPPRVSMSTSLLSVQKGTSIPELTSAISNALIALLEVMDKQP
jgi:1-acyl-sn-glycerol-3-phosphate acyltransferase